jgi:hypothetical protein
MQNWYARKGGHLGDTKWKQIYLNSLQQNHQYDEDNAACFLTVYHVRAFLLAAKPIVALFTGTAAILSLPAARARALSCHWVTRAVILAFTHIVAILPIVARRTARLTLDPTPFRLAQTRTSHRVTANTVVIMTVAHKAALLAEPSRLTFPLTQFTHVAGCTCACPLKRKHNCQHEF